MLSLQDSDDEGQSMDGESESRAAIGTLHLTGEGSDDLDRPTDRAAPQPSSALLATLEAEEEVRVKQRTQKRWIEARDLVRQEESAAALTSATNQLPTVSPSIADSGGDSTPNQVPDNPPSSDSGATDAVSVNSSANTDVAMAVPDAAPPSAPSTPPSSSAESAATVAGAVDMPALDQLAFTEAVPPMSDPRLSAPGAMAAFASVSGAKIALPPPHSLINMLYPVAASVYPPIQLSTICPDCVLLQKSSHECRMVLKHVTPSLVLDPAAVPGLGLVQWPPPPPIEPRPTPPRPFVSVRVPGIPRKANHKSCMASTGTDDRMYVCMCVPTGKTFKRMCEDCRKCHLSVHRCRVVLQHTAPEWQPAENAPPPIPRRRKPPQAKKKVGS